MQVDIHPCFDAKDVYFDLKTTLDVEWVGLLEDVEDGDGVKVVPTVLSASCTIEATDIPEDENEALIKVPVTVKFRGIKVITNEQEGIQHIMPSEPVYRPYKSRIIIFKRLTGGYFADEVKIYFSF